MNLVTLGSLLVGALSNSTQPCPSTFGDVPLAPKASYCHIFNQSSPASMSFHAPATPEQTLTFYQQTMGEQIVTASKQAGRTLLILKQGRLIISLDGTGSQVDILIEANPSSNQ